MAVSLQSRYLMGSTLAVLMVGIGFLAVAQFLGRAGAAVTERRSLDLAQQTLDRALSDLKDAETGQRGFLLTGHETYLTPYEHGRREALEKLETLQQLPGARALDPGALRRLDDLSRLKLAELARTIALAQGGRRAEALALVDTGEGLRTMDEIRAEEASMAEVLQRRRETQVASLAEASRWLRWALACTGLLSLTSLGLGAWGLHRDNRLRLAAERSLVASEARLHQMVDGIRDYAVLMLDPQGRVISWNAGAARIKGYEAREILGRDFSCFYTPEEVAAGGPARMLREALENGRAEEEGWRVRKDGSRFWADVVISALQDARGEPLGFVKVTQDLSERRRAEEDLRASERRFRTLAEAAPVGIFEMDAEGHRPYINDALCALAGLDYEEASGTASTRKTWTGFSAIGSGYTPRAESPSWNTASCCRTAGSAGWKAAPRPFPGWTASPDPTSASWWTARNSGRSKRT